MIRQKTKKLKKTGDSKRINPEKSYDDLARDIVVAEAKSSNKYSEVVSPINRLDEADLRYSIDKNTVIPVIIDAVETIGAPPMIEIMKGFYPAPIESIVAPIFRADDYLPDDFVEDVSNTSSDDDIFLNIL